MKIWNDYDKTMHSWLLRLTEEFDLTFPLEKNQNDKDPTQKNIVPCLLPEKQPDVSSDLDNLSIRCDMYEHSQQTCANYLSIL